MSIQPNASYFPVIFTTIVNYLDLNFFLRGKDLVKYLIEILGLGSVTSACLEGFTLLTRAVRSMFYIKIWSLNAVLHWRLVLTQSVHGEYPAVQNVLKCFPYLYCMDVHFVTYSTYVIYTPQQIALRPKRLFKWLKMGPDLSSDVKKWNRVVSFPILKIATVVCKGLTL